jgi:hypothetical protein
MLRTGGKELEDGDIAAAAKLGLSGASGSDDRTDKLMARFSGCCCARRSLRL